jgi:triacylglycerol lipase
VLTDAQAAELALLVLYAEDMYLGDRANLSPAPDTRLAPNWTLLGHLTAVDALFRRGQTIALGDPTCYGYLARNAEGVYVAAIRGTEGVLEWVEDGEFVPIPHPVAGYVEQGFFGIYQSLTYRPIGGVATSAAQGLAVAVGSAELIVMGHSLGSTLATYLTFDLASPVLLGARVQGCYFASPRPGDAPFAAAFDHRVGSYNLYNYELDVVPRVPFGPSYTDLPRVNWIGINAAKARIAFDLACHHHLTSYCAMLNYALLDWSLVPLCDSKNAACIKGPAP